MKHWSSLLRAFCLVIAFLLLCGGISIALSAEGFGRYSISAALAENAGILGNLALPDSSGLEILTGKCGDNITWTLYDSGLLSISGSGAIPDYSWGSSPFYNKSEITSVEIEEGVTGIGKYTFLLCPNVTSISLPDGLISIGTEAFESSYQLAKITIPASVTAIGDFAFRSCNSLQSIQVAEANTVYSSVEGVLFSKTKDTLICFPRGKSAASFVIPDGTTTIGGYAFENCGRITNITLPESLTSIGAGSFNGCQSLTEIHIPASVISIGDGAFNYCGGMVRYDVAESNPIYTDDGGVLYNKAKNTLIQYPARKSGTTYTVLSGTLSIERSAFYGAKFLSEISLPDGLKVVGSTAFDSATITHMTFPDSVTTIGNSAFWYCRNLTSVTLPASLTKLEGYVFGYCENLTSVTIPPRVNQIEYNAFSNCPSDLKLTVGENSYAHQYALDNGIDFEFGNFPTVIINSGDCGDNVTWTLDDHVLTISGSGAMYDYNGGKSPFFNNEMIQQIVIEQGVTKIGASAFERCVNLTGITIPPSVNAIGMGVFGGCSSLTSVEIPSGVTRIGDVTFGNCVSLTSVIIPASVTSISDSAFNGCNGLKIYGTPGTYAESYANAKKYPFVAIGDEPGEKPAAPHIELRQSGRTVTNNAQLSVDYDVYYESTLNTIERLEIAWGFGGAQKDDYIAEVTDLVGVVAKAVHFYDPADDWFVMARVCSDGAWSAWSEKIWFKASEGGNVTWELSENGVLVISGNGKMDSYGQGKSPFCKNNNIHRIVIEQGVTSIGSFAFEGCKELTSVSIAGSVTQIGTNAFTGCIGLSSLTFPSSVAQIGKDAFYGCSSLSNLTIPGRISNISEGAFAFCTGLTNVTIQDGVKSIDTAAFYCCYNLSSVTIPNSVTRIQNNSFYQCNNLTIYGNSGSYAESYANANYYPFVAIGQEPCEHVWGKATVPVSPTETEKGIAKMVCSVCGQKTTVEIPALKDMRTLRLPTGLTTIEAEAFAGLNVQAIIIPNGCTTIGDRAFAGCASLIYVRVPAGTVIADNAFTDCGNVILDKIK